MALVAAAGPVIGLALFCVYLAFRTGDWLAYSHAQADNSPFRNRTSPGPNGVVVAVRLAYQNLTRDGIVPWEIRDTLGTVGYGALLAVAAYKRLPWTWIVTGALALLIPVSAGTMAGTSRYALMAIPAFWVLALWARREGVFVAMVARQRRAAGAERRVAADPLAVAAAGRGAVRYDWRVGAMAYRRRRNAASPLACDPALGGDART